MQQGYFSFTMQIASKSLHPNNLMFRTLNKHFNVMEPWEQDLYKWIKWRSNLSFIYGKHTCEKKHFSHYMKIEEF